MRAGKQSSGSKASLCAGGEQEAWGRQWGARLVQGPGLSVMPGGLGVSMPTSLVICWIPKSRAAR